MVQRSRWLWLGVVAAAWVACQWIVHALIVDAEASNVRTALSVLNGVPHAAINLFLLWVFGRTLAGRGDSLITGFARRIHGTLPPHIETYTRRTTIAWCIFFGAQVAVSAGLYAFASLDSWSFFVNVLSFPLIALMFVLEYAYRVARFRDWPHSSMWKGIEAFVVQRKVARPDDAGSPH